MRRELNDTEKRIINKNVKRIKAEQTHLEYLIEYQDLMINKGLWQNYLEKMEEFKKMKEQMLEDLKMNYHKLDLLQEQLDKGVEIIEEDKNVVGIG